MQQLFWFAYRQKKTPEGVPGGKLVMDGKEGAIYNFIVTRIRLESQEVF
jgi:hypothetical protein